MAEAVYSLDSAPSRDLKGLRVFARLPFAVFGVLVVAEIAAILALNGGMFVYSLDDAYIHLSLADRIWAGTYGINAGEVSAPASSILWPFLLAVFSPLPASAYTLVPLVLNVAAAFATLRLLVAGLRGALTGDGRPFGPAAAIFATGLIFIVNLVPIIFTGMEHSLQQLLAVVLVRGLMVEGRIAQVPRSAWLAVVLLPIVRYDSLALAAPALLYFLWRGHVRGAVLAGLAIGAVLGAFSSFMITHGLDILPASVMAKSDVARSGGLLVLLRNVYSNLANDTQVNILLLGGILGLAAACDRGRAAPERGLACVITAALVVEILFGRLGAYYRYEAYISGALVIALLHLYRGVLARVFAASAPGAGQVIAIGGLTVASLSYLIALASTPAATNNIYDQQYQMHRFAVDFYRRPVAVNDLGWMAFRNPSYILDLGGLASREALLARTHESGPDWMRRLASAHGVQLAMIYDGWYPQRPPGWIRVGQLTFDQMRVTAGDSKVSFYATDADSVESIRTALEKFRETLPKRTGFQFDTP